MKIGILTLPLHINYGGILQAYALQTVLERMGHEVVVLNESRFQKLPPCKVPLIYGKRFIKKYILNRKCQIFEEQYHNRIYPIISQYTQQFIDTYIHYITPKDLSFLNPKDFDAIVVGSDQIWRSKYYPKIENAYLAFAKNWDIKRLAYAASFGTDKWEYSPIQTNKCKQLAQKFDAISIRELSGVSLCRQYFEIEVQHVLDPTMLLDKEDYIKLFEKAKTPKSSGNMLVYVLDETQEKTALINNIAQKKGLTPFRVNSQIENPNTPLEKRIQPPVEQWLRGFYDAEFIVTDSFHACVFSILFGKPFIVYGNESRGMSRFESLLHLFTLEDRLTTNSNNIPLSDINWSNIEKQLAYLRIKSQNFLQEHL